MDNRGRGGGWGDCHIKVMGVIVHPLKGTRILFFGHGLNNFYPYKLQTQLTVIYFDPLTSFGSEYSR